MPIAPEFRKRYPPHWQELRAQIMVRAGGCCERCGKPDRARVEVIWDGSGRWRLSTAAGVWRDRNQQPAAAPNPLKTRSTLVVLALCHWPDRSPEACDPDGLFLLCQGCHQWIDRSLHIASYRRTCRRRRERHQVTFAHLGLELPAPEEPLE